MSIGIYSKIILRSTDDFKGRHFNRVNETYIKVEIQWKYLYRTINTENTLIDLLLTTKINIKAAQCFFRKAFK